MGNAPEINGSEHVDFEFYAKRYEEARSSAQRFHPEHITPLLFEKFKQQFLATIAMGEEILEIAQIAARTSDELYAQWRVNNSVGNDQGRSNPDHSQAGQS